MCNYFDSLEKKEKHEGELGSFTDFVSTYEAPTVCQVLF